MSQYVDFTVVGQVIAAGLLLGAGLPLVFALGLRSLSVGTGGGTVQAAGFEVTRKPVALVMALVCFAVVLAAIVLGIHLIIHKS